MCHVQGLVGITHERDRLQFSLLVGHDGAIAGENLLGVVAPLLFERLSHIVSQVIPMQVVHDTDQRVAQRMHHLPRSNVTVTGTEPGPMQLIALRRRKCRQGPPCLLHQLTVDDVASIASTSCHEDGNLCENLFLRQWLSPNRGPRSALPHDPKS